MRPRSDQNRGPVDSSICHCWIVCCPRVSSNYTRQYRHLAPYRWVMAHRWVSSPTTRRCLQRHRVKMYPSSFRLGSVYSLQGNGGACAVHLQWPTSKDRCDFTSLVKSMAARGEKPTESNSCKFVCLGTDCESLADCNMAENNALSLGSKAVFDKWMSIQTPS